MGIFFRAGRDLNVRVTKRGVRFGIGPRAARMHVGAGRPTVSTGWGPFTIWEPIGRKRSARRRGR